MVSHRKERLEELLKRIIAESLYKEIKDPRIGFVTVVNVGLSRDYKVADVRISLLGSDDEKKKSMLGLESAKNYIQFIIGKNIKLRVTPKIRFHIDTSIEEGVRMVNMIDNLTAGSKNESSDDENASDENASDENASDENGEDENQ